MDRNPPYESNFPTTDLSLPPARYYIRAAVLRANGSSRLQGWRTVYIDPPPTVPRFRVRPLLVAGTPKVVGMNLYGVPSAGVDVFVFGGGFKETRGGGRTRSAISLELARLAGERRTYRITGGLTMGRAGLARLEVAIVPRGAPKQRGVLVRARSIVTILRRNAAGDTTAHQAPNGYQCWQEFRQRKASCSSI